MSSLIPEEIYLDILLRVPVKSTFVCKCVCKSWFYIISDPDFDKLHLNLATTRTNNYRLVLSCCEELAMFPIKEIFGYSVSYDLLSPSNESDDGVVEMGLPYKSSSNYTTELLTSCNGLVYGWNRHLKFFFLWNPATREYKRLPKLQDRTSCFLCTFHGFGYDYKTDDYKLVTNMRKDRNLIQVYSLKSESWKSFRTIQYGSLIEARSGVLFNGALHWLRSRSSETSSLMIVSMNISEERFEELQLPVTLPIKISMFEIDMGVLEECLCVGAHSQRTFQVWVMQDYGISESWTKLYTIMFESMSRSVCFNVKLIGSFKDGEILFKNQGHITLYDTNHGATRIPNINNIHGLVVRNAVSYVESLVSLNSLSAVGRRKKREITRNLGESKTKKRNRNLPKQSRGSDCRKN